jgi:thiol-disulfide isomerase/thioredoxin
MTIERIIPNNGGKNILILYMPAKNSKKYVPRTVSPASLYGAKDDVVILGDSDFIGGRLSGKAFQGPGILKAYANWCPHCQNIVKCVCELGQICKKEGVKMAIYVIEAQENSLFAEEQAVEGFPTFFAVDTKGGLRKLASHSLEDVVDEICETCRTNSAFKGKCFSKQKTQRGLIQRGGSAALIQRGGSAALIQRGGSAALIQRGGEPIRDRTFCKGNNYDEVEDCVQDPISLACIDDEDYFRTSEGHCYSRSSLRSSIGHNPRFPLTNRQIPQRVRAAILGGQQATQEKILMRNQIFSVDISSQYRGEDYRERWSSLSPADKGRLHKEASRELTYTFNHDMNNIYRTPLGTPMKEYIKKASINFTNGKVIVTVPSNVDVVALNRMLDIYRRDGLRPFTPGLKMVTIFFDNDFRRINEI